MLPLSPKQYTITSIITVIIASCMFIGFGLSHITQFETTDEHFWKYDRIQKYYNGIVEGVTENNWKKTRINDKPGVSVALISGTGLLFIENPKSHRNHDEETRTSYVDSDDKTRKLYHVFHTERTASLNAALRVPIVLFNGLILVPLFFYLLLRIFNAPAHGVFAREKKMAQSTYTYHENPSLQKFFMSMQTKKALREKHNLQITAEYENPSDLLVKKTEGVHSDALTPSKQRIQSFIPHIALLLIALNPLLIGISQIVNPDALLWSFGLASILSYWTLLRTGEKNFIMLTGALMGFAVLSKYSANLLYVLFALFFVLHALHAHKNAVATQLRFYALSFMQIVILSWSIIIIFMPAAIQKPAHFLYATIASPALLPLINLPINVFSIEHFFYTESGEFKTIALGILSLFIFILITIALPLLAVKVLRRCRTILTPVLIIITTLFFVITLLSLYNAWTNTSLFSLNNIKEVSRVDGEMLYPQITTENIVMRPLLISAIQMQNLIFSLHPLVLIGFVIACIITLIRKKDIQLRIFLLFTLITTAIFIGGAVQGDLFVNIRYGILLYPLFAIITAIGIHIMCAKIYSMVKLRTSYAIAIMLFLCTLFITSLTISLTSSKPHYFNYESILLPKEHVVTDAWGYGIYEAAQWLNAQPNAKEAIVWSDRDGLCQFFVGKCIRAQKIDLNHTTVDYFVFSRRGLLRKPFAIIEDTTKDSALQKELFIKVKNKEPEWKIYIDQRPGNFIKIIKTPQ